jgi:hypothetical protein
MRFRSGKGFSMSCAAALALLVASPALAVVKREGEWPEKDKLVSLDVARAPREEAIRKLAEAAGWSVVVHAPQADPVDIHVKDQPASKVLDLLLLDADYVATRDGSLVSIRRAAAATSAPSAPSAPGTSVPSASAPTVPEAPAPPVIPSVAAVPTPPEPPELPAPPAPPGKRGRDRDVTGNSLKIAKNEVVDDVSVVGGSLDVYGTVTGDIDVAGGAVHIHPGARVHGDVSALGGSITIDDGARVDGEIEAVGGAVHRGEKAIIGGAVHGSGQKHSDTGHDRRRRPRGRGGAAGPPRARGHAGQGREGRRRVRAHGAPVRARHRAARARAGADGPAQGELVARPMRSFAMGVLGMIVGSVAFVVLCVTVIGVPFALIGAVAAMLAVLGGMCAVLETVGRALTRHRTQNPYVHLLLGCGLFLAVSAIPVLGPIVAAVVVLLATGLVVSTRVAGLVQRRPAGTPYRTAAA